MTQKNTTVIFRIYRILLSISIIAAGLCLIYGCLSIYYSGDKPYSRQIVADTFSLISVPVYICLGLSAVSLVSGLIFPDLSEKHKPEISYKSRLELLLSKKDLTALKGEQAKALEKERKKRKAITAFKWAVTAVASVAFLVYALNGSNFDSSDINTSVINAMWVLLPCLCVMLAVSVLAEILMNQSCKEEIELIKKLPSAKSTSGENENNLSKSHKRILILRCAILLLSAGILIYGFATGGVYDVLTKAVNICTECIGLG